MANTAKNRPLSPHLFIYKPIPTMISSITHRATGIALYVGTLLVAWWLVAAASGPAYFDFVNGVMGSWFGLLVLFGFSLALVQHFLGGLRHLGWDLGYGLEKHTSTRMAIGTFIATPVITILLWIVGYMAR